MYDYGGATVHHDMSRFPCSPVGTHVVFTQDIVQLEKCVGSLMSLLFPLCSHYPPIDRWSQSCIGVSFEYNAEYCIDNLMWMEGNLFTPSRDRRPFVEDRSQPWHVRQ